MATLHINFIYSLRYFYRLKYEGLMKNKEKQFNKLLCSIDMRNSVV